MTYEESLSKNITTTRTTRPDVPQVSIKNPLDADIFVNLIEILPNVDFALNGKLEIQINNAPVLDANSDSFRQYSKFPLSLGKKLNRGFKVDIFAWNQNNSDEIRCDFNIHLSSEQKQIPSVAIPLTADQRNNAISDSEILFDAVLRPQGTTVTKLISMVGYRSLIAMINSAQYSSGATVIDGSSQLIDGDLATIGDQEFHTVNPVNLGKIDFGSIATRIPTTRIQKTNGLYAQNFTLDISNDGVAWSNVVSQNIQNAGFYTLQGASQSFRFMRVQVSGTLTGEVYNNYEMYDANLFGGSASLSFEILDRSTNTWLELISAAAIGAISQGQALVKTIGDTINDVANNKFNYKLPSTQTDFRAKLVISVASSNVGVSMAKVA